MTTDLQLTLGAIEERGWAIVLLEPGTKRLREGRTWDECATRSVAEARNWLRRGGGLGLDVYSSGLVVLDLDAPRALERLCARAGPLPPTATSPSGGTHVYLAPPREGPSAPVPGAQPAGAGPGAAPAPPGATDGAAKTLPAPAKILPAAILLDGERLGEIIRGPRQQVVIPPTPYPGNVKRGVPPGGEYLWITDPRLPPYVFPPDLLALLTESAPTDDPTLAEGLGLHPDEPWTGPAPEEILRRALTQPGARRRTRGVKFRCKACHDDHHDRHMDNAFVGLDGRWGCAFAPGDSRHRRAIGIQLGILGPTPEHTQLAEEIVSDEVVERIMRSLNEQE